MHCFTFKISGFQTQLIHDQNRERIPQQTITPAQDLRAGFPREETGNYRELEEHFGGKIIAVLEDDTEYIEVLVITIESTPFIVEELI